jgi:hypothetical protein
MAPITQAGHEQLAENVRGALEDELKKLGPARAP